MTFRPAKALPWMLALLAACSPNAPGPAISAPSPAGGPTARLTAAPDIHESVRQLTARGPDNLDISAGPVAGTRIIRIRAGYSEVVLARTNADGTVSTRCVDSAPGAEAFLGETASTSPTKAAQ